MKREYLYGMAGIALAVALMAMAYLPGTPPQKVWEATSSSNNLTLVMRLDTNEYKVGEQMNVTLRLTNRGGSKVALVFPTPQRFDFKVVDEGGRERYRWSSERFFLQVITTITLEPGETLEQTLTWVIDLQPGSYTIVGMTARFTFEEGQAPIILETTGIPIQVS